MPAAQIHVGGRREVHLMKQEALPAGDGQEAPANRPPAQPDANHIELRSAPDSGATARNAAATDEVPAATSKWAVLGIVAVGVFMATLDSSIVNISLPTIAHYFGAALSGPVEWVIIAYLVIVAAGLLTIGRLADLIGRKPV